jgi:hypothetical protein
MMDCRLIRGQAGDGRPAMTKIEFSEGVQLNRMTRPAIIRLQPMNSIIGQLGRGF